MGRRAKNDAIDRLCKEWAKVRRQLLNLADPEVAREYLGAVRCTLGQRRDLHAGAKSNKVDQHYPEVYEGDAFYVNQAFKRMRPQMKAIMDIHFCYILTLEQKSDLFAMSDDTYLRSVNDARAFVEGYMASISSAA